MIDGVSLHESVGRVLQSVCLCALPVVLGALGLVWLRMRGICTLKRILARLKTLNGCLAVLAVAALAAWAGKKPVQESSSSQGLNFGSGKVRQPGEGILSIEGNSEDSGEATTIGMPDAVGAFAVASVMTNAAHDFSMPTNAVVCEQWLRRGAARDWFSITNDRTWAFPFGASAIRRMTVLSMGAARMHVDKATENADVSLLAPLRTILGIVPACNWNRAAGLESSFWSASTPSNTLLLTWQDVLFGRSSEKPISLQVELMPSGRFRFAYDLRSLTADDLATNVLAGAFCGECRVTVAPPPGVVSVIDFHVSNPVDMDNDGLNDAEEMLHGTDPELSDTDGDGVDDCNEVRRDTNPADPDTDADGLSDGEEVALGTNPRVVDSDGDGLGDGLEVEVYGSDPFAVDSDGDGLGDAAEVLAGTSPVLADTDGDGLSDSAEQTVGTNPLLKDTDGDGATDGEEVAAGSNPLVRDTDGDGLLDGQELNAGSSPVLVDTDGDGLTDPEEVALGTDPASADTDSDGIPDWGEINCLAVRPAEWLDIPGGTVLMACSEENAVRDGLVTTNLCTPVSMGGKVYDRVVVDLHGRIHLVPANGVPALPYSSGWNPDPSDISLEADDVIVAGFWDELILRPHLGSKVLLARCPSNSCTIVQYEDVGIYDASGTNACLTFQIVLGGDTNFPIRVNYHELVTNEYFYATPTLGVVNRGRLDFRNHSRCQRLIYAYNDISGFSVPLSLGYRLGTGTDSKRADTDGDGLMDGDEFTEGTNPWNPDCDGDGLPDGDEIDAETDPLDADSDNDGMPDGWESFTGAGKVAKILVLDGGLWADYNRVDGIDGSDKSKAYRGKRLRHWYNDDDDDGPTNETPLGDVPAASSTPDCANGHVDGRCDVLDFTPVWIDMGAALNQIAEQLGKSCTLTLAQEDGAVNLVWTSLTGESVANFLKTDVTGCGESLVSDLAAAQTVHLTEEALELPESFVTLMRGDRNKGIILIEGRCPDGDSSAMSVAPLVLRIYEKPRTSDATPLCELRLPLSLSSVEEMYRWLDLRQILGVTNYISSRLGTPSNLPDSECDGKNYVFVHGYNVSKENARGWASEIFKRLRQSGSQSMFTAVDWYGDHSQFEMPFYDKVSPDYYRNVEYAFRSAPALVSHCAALPGAKVMLAHSLGNMLVSSAAADYGLDYVKYCMINAAVPMEAYYDEAYAPQMIDKAWTSVANGLWSSHWGEQFREGDFRRTLSWKGRFAGIQNAVNFYSPSDEVLENPPSLGLGGAWAKQELFKGVSMWKVVNGLHIENVNVACEGGWGINPYFAFRPDCYLPFKGFIGLRFTGYTNSAVRPLFTPFADSSLHRNGLDGRVDDILRARMLGDAIPAESFATGANALHVRARIVNYNMATYRQNGSPRLSSARWKHSDIKNVAFYYVYSVFEEFLTERNE